MSSTQASRYRGVSKDFLSKIWLVLERLAKKAVERNTKMLRYSNDNSLYRNHATNDNMLRYKRLQSVLFTDNIFATKHKSTKDNT